MSRSPARGFTLVELLVALAIFAVLSVLTYGGVRQILRLDDGLHAASERSAALELAVATLEQDLNQLVARAVRDELGDSEPALRAGLAGDLLSLTRATPGLPDAVQPTALTRVRYRLVDGALYRDVFADLDRIPGSAYRSRRLLVQLNDFSLRFFANDSWTEYWPRDADAGGATGSNSLPQGVEFTIELAPGLTLRRVLAREG